MGATSHPPPTGGTGLAESLSPAILSSQKQSWGHQAAGSPPGPQASQARNEEDGGGVGGSSHLSNALVFLTRSFISPGDLHVAWA